MMTTDSYGIDKYISFNAFELRQSDSVRIDTDFKLNTDIFGCAVTGIYPANTLS